MYNLLVLAGFVLLFVVGIVAAIIGIPVFIQGVKAKADLTVFIGSGLIAVSATCIGLLIYNWY